ncbi:MAG: PQQ-binding-like beta-propeller repeat protein [Bacteroidales bacterium]|nr:PQQ-binding-like beta-propeller repeat protein [Bacteroidales bacterium]
MKFISLTVVIYTMSVAFSFAQKANPVKIHIGTYLGNEERNYYGNEAPSKLDTLWRTYLGEGVSPAYGNPQKVWKGAGWTGQPLVVEENGEIFLIQGAFDYNLKKIKAETGEIVWEYRFDDIIKGTGTIWENAQPESPENKYIIIQGSRRGVKKPINAKYCPSLRGISFYDGSELWRMNVKRTISYSRDVDGSALVIDDTAYLALENGLFTVFSPDPENTEMRNGMMQPKIYKEIPFFLPEDTLRHGRNIESESSPCFLDGRVYTTSGSGRVYGYNISKGLVDWVFGIGADLNGSPVVTSDSCLLIPVEKQYIEGRGGVFKLDPSKDPDNCVVWYYPVEDTAWFHWEGGVIGSVAVNDRYHTGSESNLAAFVGVDGSLVVVDHKSTDTGKLVLGPDNKQEYSSPRVVFTEETGGTISTPIFTDDRLIVPLDSGLYLYEYTSDHKFRLLDKIDGIQIDATPVVWNGKLYVASLDGYLYCFGEKR